MANPSVQNPPWVGTVMTTAPLYLKQVSDQTIRNRMLLAMLQKKDRIVMNMSGYEMNWDVQYRVHPVTAYGDFNNLDYNRTNLWKQAVLGWRGYKSTDAYSRMESQMNKGDVAIINRASSILGNLSKAVTKRLGSEMYVDGFASGNELRLCGFGSFSGQGTCASTDKVCQPSDTYAGLSTSLADQGGTWTTNLTGTDIPNATVATDWPLGSGSEEYDYWCPKIFNATASTWGTGGTTWATNCENILRYAQQCMIQGGGEEDKPNLALLNGNWMIDFKNRMSSKQRIIVNQDLGAKDLGFPSALNFEGLTLDSDFDVPANEGYVFNIDQMALMCLEDELLHNEGPHYEPTRDAWLFNVGIFGNLMFNPKYFAKIKNIA